MLLTAHLGKFSILDHKTLLMCAYKCLIVSKLNRQLRYVDASFFNKFSKWLVRPQPRAFYSARLIGDPLLRRGSVLGKG